MKKYTLQNKKCSPAQFNDAMPKKIYQLYNLGFPTEQFSPSKNDHKLVEESYSKLQLALQDQGLKIYGIHTSYGENVRNSKSPQEWKNTQKDLLEYLSVGVGEHLPEAVVRRALRLQAIKVSYGLSGIHPETYKDLVNLSNSLDLPKVPRKGSLGASGDLISMAHAIAPLFAGQDPKGPRDVIGLINTNSIMASWAIHHFVRLNRLMNLSYFSTALTSIGTMVGEECFSKNGLGRGNVHNSYMDAGQKIIQFRNEFNKLFFENGSVEGLGGGPSLLQPRYSIRCAPQIMGLCDDLFKFSAERIASESTSVTDNPLIISDEDENEVKAWHGGLFYASGIANSADQMMDVVGKLGEMLDRQVLILMDSNLNGGLPDNLNTSDFGHCKGIHQLLSSLCQELRGLAVPSRNMSFSCEGNNQDLVPCGMTVLNNLDRALNSFTDIVRGALFVSLRGALLAKGCTLPRELEINSWKDFQLDTFEEIVGLKEDQPLFRFEQDEWTVSQEERANLE